MDAALFTGLWLVSKVALAPCLRRLRRIPHHDVLTKKAILQATTGHVRAETQRASPGRETYAVRRCAPIAAKRTNLPLPHFARAAAGTNSGFPAAWLARGTGRLRAHRNVVVVRSSVATFQRCVRPGLVTGQSAV